MRAPRAYYNEIDPYAAQFLRNLIAAGHIAPGDVDTRSIEDVHPNDLKPYNQHHFYAGCGVWSYALRQAGWPDSRPVGTASCPCQPFSSAGAGAGFDDERHLWPATHYLIGFLRTAEFFGEQVASKDADIWIDLVQADMEALGYAFGAIAFPSAGIGAPHIRDRTYWMAHSPSGGLREGYAPFGGLENQRAGLADGWLVGELENPEHGRRGGREPIGGWPSSTMPSSIAVGLADSDFDRLGTCALAELYDGQFDPQSRGGARGLALADRDGYDRAGGLTAKPGGNRQGNGVSVGSGRQLREPARPGPTNGYWSDSDWLRCRDDKWRPVEPGAFPLAHGAAGRVGRLRAYGNAINAQAAIAFIEAYLSH